MGEEQGVCTDDFGWNLNVINESLIIYDFIIVVDIFQMLGLSADGADHINMLGLSVDCADYINMFGLSIHVVILIVQLVIRHFLLL